jgi:hypothetical protein
VLRFEATAHNTKDLKVGRALDKFPTIVARLADIAERFCAALDCVDTGFLTDHTLDELPRPSQIGAVRIGGIDLNKPRIHDALRAVLALASTPGGFTVGQLAAKVCTLTGQTSYTVRQAAYDLRKLRGKRLMRSGVVRRVVSRRVCLVRWRFAGRGRCRRRRLGGLLAAAEPRSRRGWRY